MQFGTTQSKPGFLFGRQTGRCTRNGSPTGPEGAAGPNCNCAPSVILQAFGERTGLRRSSLGHYRE